MKCAGLTGLEPQSLHGARLFFQDKEAHRQGNRHVIQCAIFEPD